MPQFSRPHLQIHFTHSLEQIITMSTRVTDHFATVIDHILTNSKDKVSQSDVIDLGLSSLQTSLLKSHKHNEIFVQSMKRYSSDDTYSDFVYIFVGAINLIYNPSKKREDEDRLKTLV